MMAEKEKTVFDYLVNIKKNLYAHKPIDEYKQAIENLVQNNPYRDYYLKVLEATEQWSDMLRIEGDFSEEYDKIRENFAQQRIMVALDKGAISGIVFVW
ncbi:MAG: hypothetical protein IJN50_04390 [Clostridia bacterium]|nr:hypothetical protein [Clostridia bacterium]